MALELCNDCPSNCVGNEYTTDCGYIGVSIPSKGIVKGDSLTGVLEKLAETTSVAAATSNATSTDDIITDSLVRNPSALCASKITTRDFEYKLNTTSAGATFSWNVLNIVSNLPSGYKVGTISVKATGKAIGNETTLFNSTKLSAAQKIDLNRFPVSVDINLRVVTDCGNVDMTKQVYLSAPITQEMSRVFMRVNDLLPGSTEGLILTQQLDILEANVQFNGQKLNELEIVELNGVQRDFRQVIVEQSQSIESIQDSIADPGAYSITYESSGASQTDSISDVITNLYATINSQADDIAQLQVDVDTLKAQIATLI